MGVDCFGRKVDGVFEIMLTKTMRDEYINCQIKNITK